MRAECGGYVNRNVLPWVGLDFISLSLLLSHSGFFSFSFFFIILPSCHPSSPRRKRSISTQHHPSQPFASLGSSYLSVPTASPDKSIHAPAAAFFFFFFFATRPHKNTTHFSTSPFFPSVFTFHSTFLIEVITTRAAFSPTTTTFFCSVQSERVFVKNTCDLFIILSAYTRTPTKCAIDHDTTNTEHRSSGIRRRAVRRRTKDTFDDNGQRALMDEKQEEGRGRKGSSMGGGKRRRREREERGLFLNRQSPNKQQQEMTRQDKLAAVTRASCTHFFNLKRSFLALFYLLHTLSYSHSSPPILSLHNRHCAPQGSLTAPTIRPLHGSTCSKAGLPLPGYLW